MKKLLFSILFIIPFLSYSQSANDDLIHWNKRSKLKWSDYKGPVNTESDAAASTTTYLAIEYNINRNGFSFKIACSFSKNRSWGRHKTDYILAHEQGHFDIAEIFARLLNKEMSEYKFNSSSYQTDLQKIYQEVTDKKEKFQDNYDEETNHSIIKEKQEEWVKKIADMLEELKDYAKY